MPPVRIHVGDDEVLLDDSVRYAERAVTAGVDVRFDVWMGLPHGFAGSVGRLKAAALALDDIGAFLARRSTTARSAPTSPVREMSATIERTPSALKVRQTIVTT
jgi:monoterpene epsilon-lactone hydrolase